MAVVGLGVGQIHGLLGIGGMVVLVSVAAAIEPRAPLQADRSWAASPDSLWLPATGVLGSKPQVIPDAGGGDPTLVIGCYLQKLGDGHLASLDHDKGLAEKITRAIDRDGLTEWVAVMHVPLVPHTVQRDGWQWHGLTGWGVLVYIATDVVQGPRAGEDPLARFLPLPLVSEPLRPGARTILTDGVRPGERGIVERWSSETNSSFEQHSLENGEFVGCSS